mgnify:CR=1 FL=1
MKRNIISYGKQFIAANDSKHVLNSLKNEIISNGPYVEKFEKKLSNFLNSKYTLVCNSGTSALHLAFLTLGVKKDDVVIMPSINFIASFSVCTSLGAKIYLSDVDETGQMSSKNVIECIKKFNLRKIKCVVAMHLGGTSQNIVDISKLKKKYNFHIIEDACHALGTTYKSKNNLYKTGSSHHSDISIFSFHPVKAITTGEGGALSTRSQKYYEIAKLYRSHGIVRKKKYWDYDIKYLGYNFRLSDINCALGISQLNSIRKFIEKRKKIARYYHEHLKPLSNFLVPNEKYNNFSSYHLFIIRLNFKNLKRVNKDVFINFMKKNRINLQFHYKPIYNYFFFRKTRCEVSYKVNSNEYLKNAVSLPIYYNLDQKSLKKVIAIIKKFINKYKK